MRLAQNEAFTLIELVVVLAILVLLGGTLMTGMAKTKPNTNAIQCLNNNRQLNAAWRMYADDNRDRFVYSSDDGTASLNPLNQYAWSGSHMDFNPNNRVNWDITVDIVVRPLWTYAGKSASVYKCPSDKSFVTVNGQAKPRVRSMSMNFYLGGYAGSDGGWPFAKPFVIYSNLVQVSGGLPTPGPAKLWVFTDERDDWINWGNFITDMTGYQSVNPAAYQFQDLPGMYHHLAAGFSYADGHCEMHRWTDPRTTPPRMDGAIAEPINLASPRNADVSWLQDHSTRPK
jgi:prepilin-type N-terminal cleavage/methylation domain-containing protein